MKTSISSIGCHGFGRRAIDALVNLFAMKMAGVFMISTCTIGLRSAIFPRWIAFAGYACALVLLLVIANWKWIALVFPLWMLLVSMQILLAEFRSRFAGEAALGQHQPEQKRNVRNSRKAEETPRSAPALDESTRLAFERTAILREHHDLSGRKSHIANHFRFQHLQILSDRSAKREATELSLGPREFALALVGIGLFSLLLATIENRQNIRSLGAQYAGKRRSLSVLVAALISILGVFALLAMIFRE